MGIRPTALVIRTAAALLGVLLAAGCADEGQGDVDPAGAPSSATPTPSSTAAPRPWAWVDALPVGPPPRIGYVVGHTYHSADGEVVPLPRNRGITSITRLGEGFLATDDRYFEGTAGVFRLDERGRVDVSRVAPGHQPGFATMSSYPVVAADGSAVHWITFTPPESGLALPTVLHRGDAASGAVTHAEFPFDPGYLPRVVGVVGEDLILYGRSSWVVGADGQPRRARWPGTVRTVSDRGELLATARGERQRIAAVIDYATNRTLWRGRGIDPESFTPSGRRLLALTREGAVVLDSRSGKVLRLLEHSRGHGRWSSSNSAWEDGRHLLVGVQRGKRAAIARVDVRTGAWELAIDWMPLEGTDRVTFETRP